MAVNRFYSPSRGQYISQFVPKQLPVDLMGKALYAKQAQADQNLARALEKGQWTQRALPGEDTREVQRYEEKLKSFADESLYMDKTSPEWQRKYLEIVSEVQGSQDLKTIAANYDKHQRALERKKELIKKGEDAPVSAFWDEYDRAYNIYTTGLGYKGDTDLGDEMFLEGINEQKAKEELFNHIGEDSIEGLRNVPGEDLYYSVTHGGKSAGKLQNAVSQQWYSYITGAPGKQMTAKYKEMVIPREDENGKPITQQQYLSSLSKEEREQFETNMYDWIKKDLVNTAETFITKKRSTTQETALNTLAGWNREDKIDEQAIITTTMSGIGEEGVDLSWTEQVNKAKEDVKNYTAELEAIKNGTKSARPDKKKWLEDQIAKLNQGIDLTMQSKKTAYDQVLAPAKANFESSFNSIKANLSPEGQKALQEGYQMMGPEMFIALERAKQGVAYRDATTQDQIAAGILNNLSKEDKAKLTSDPAGLAISRRYINDAVSATARLKDIPVDENLLSFHNITTVPKFDGSVAIAEEKLINDSKNQGFTIWIDGKEALNTDQYSEFNIAGLTQENYMGEGLGRVGTMTRTRLIPDPNNPEEVKTEKEVVNVTLTSNNPNENSTRAGYAYDYWKTHNALQKSAQKAATEGTTLGNAAATAKDAQAHTSSRMSLMLVDPELANFFDQASKASNFRSGVINLPGKVPIVIEKKDDGSVDIKYLDEDNPDVSNPVYTNTKRDLQSAQEELHRVNLTE